MDYDLNKYRRVIKPQIKHWCDYRPTEAPHTMINMLALSTSCPIVVICYLMAELYGMTPELRRSLDKLEHFYTVENILNKETT